MTPYYHHRTYCKVCHSQLLIYKLRLKDVSDEELQEFEAGLAEDAPWQNVKLEHKTQVNIMIIYKL